MKQSFGNGCDLELLKAKTVAIIGYCGDGCLHAKSLRSKGINTVIGVPDGSAEEESQAACDGFAVTGVGQAVKQCDVIAVLLPDERQEELFEGSVKANLDNGKLLLFSTGYNVFYNKIRPPENADVVMVKSRGSAASPNQVSIAIYQDASGKALEYARAYASIISGEGREIIRTSFAWDAEEALLNKLAMRSTMAALCSEGMEVLSYSGYLWELGFVEDIKSLDYAAYIIENGGCIFMTYKMKGSDRCFRKVVGADGVLCGRVSGDF